MGVDVTHIPYRSGGQAMQEMIAGRIDYQCSGSAAAISLIKTDQVKAIAILSRNRTSLLPAYFDPEESMRLRVGGSSVDSL